ncbi:MAG: TIGR00701 family protein [Acidiferrobacteraceae bacterium]|nr:TIGR00701 family protein [Acidiferrobacteraceae bacterium]|tara:strand:- start:1902 stop:2315 length:414 start_codon:yes stop_codon:yes gene_type:complete
MLWLKSFHIIFMVTWFAGLFYLPRLFVYHAAARDNQSKERFITMERRLLYGITTPGSILTIITGLWLWASYDIIGDWIYVKSLLVLLLILYQAWCGIIVQKFKKDRNTRTSTFFRWFNEFPTIILMSVVLLSVLKPF